MRWPLRYSFREDSGERTTSKFRWVNSSNQKGRFSYIFSPKGMPILPREPSPFPLPWRARSLAYLYRIRSGRWLGSSPRGREHRLPETNRRPPSKEFTVREQWLVHSPQVAGLAVWVNFSRASRDSRADFSSPRSRAARAAPKAPMIPEITGRVTSRPSSCSKARSTASLRKVPPWTTMCFPKSSAFAARITL